MGRARLAEVVAALSLATDLGMGQEFDFGLSVARLAVDLGQRLQLDQADQVDVYYLALVKHIGCTSDAFEWAGFSGGDDNGLRSRAMLWPAADPLELARDVARHVGAGRPLPERARLVAGMVAAGRERPRRVSAAHCEAGGRLAQRLGLSEGVQRALRHEQERWDGKGLPDGLSGTAVALAQRVVVVAHDAVRLAAAGAPVPEVVRRRAGGAYDPAVVAVFQPAWDEHLAASGDPWDLALACEPGGHVHIADDGLDAVCLALADFVDLKSPYLLGHSTRGRRARRLGGGPAWLD